MSIVLAIAFLSCGPASREQEDRGILLYRASESADLDTVVRLLEEGIDPNTLVRFSDTEPASTALIAAASRGHVRIVEALLNEGADPGRSDATGMVPLDFAQEPKVWTLLLQYGADANVRERMGSPLAFAAAIGSEAKVEALLAAGADPNLAGDGGETVLRVAAGNVRVSVVKMLLAAGADVNAKTEAGETALMAPFENVYRLVMAEDVEHERVPELLRILIEAGADVNAKNKNGDSVLGLARRGGRFPVDETVEVLVAAGAK